MNYFKKLFIAGLITFKLNLGVGKACMTARKMFTDAYWLLGGNQKRKKIKPFGYSNVWGRRYF